MTSPISIDFCLQSDGTHVHTLLVARDNQERISVSDVKQQLQAELDIKVSALYLADPAGDLFIGFDSKGLSTRPFPNLSGGRYLLKIRVVPSGSALLNVEIALVENPTVVLHTLALTIDDQNRISLTDLKKWIQLMLGYKDMVLYTYAYSSASSGSSSAPTGIVGLPSGSGSPPGSDLVNLSALPPPVGGRIRFLVGKPQVAIDFSVSMDQLNVHEWLLKKALHKIVKEHYFIGLVAMHQPDGKPIQQVVKDVSPTICGNPRNEIVGSCLAMHLEVEPNTRGSIIVSAQLWEEDGKEAAALHAKSLYDPDEVTKLFNPCLRDSEQALSAALSQVSTGLGSMGKLVNGVPIPQALAVGTALQGTSELFSMGSKFYEHWKYPDFEGLYLTIFRYHCSETGVVTWYWEPDSHRIHSATVSLPNPIPVYQTAPFLLHSLVSNAGSPFLIQVPHPEVFGFDFAISKHFSMVASVCLK